MKIWIVKEELEWLQEMQDEGRTRTIEVSSFKRFADDREVEIDTDKEFIDSPVWINDIKDFSNAKEVDE